MDAGAGGVEGSVAELVETPEGGATGGPVSISIGDINVNGAEVGDDPRALAEGIRDELANILEGVSIELGAT